VTHDQIHQVLFTSPAAEAGARDLLNLKKASYARGHEVFDLLDGHQTAGTEILDLILHGPGENLSPVF